MKRPFWQFSRNDSVIILTKRGLPLLTAVRDFVYMSASLKSNILTGNYLDFVWIKCLKDILIQLRMGVLPLNANRFRYAHENASKILCSVCETKIEDKVHFICFCPLYNVLRHKYIHRYLQTEHSFTILMDCHEKNSSQNLPFFVFHACKKNVIFTCYWNRLAIVRGFPWGQMSNGACGRVWLHVTKRILSLSLSGATAGDISASLANQLPRVDTEMLEAPVMPHTEFVA